MKLLCSTLPNEVSSRKIAGSWIMEIIQPAIIDLTNRSVHSIRLENGQVVRVVAVSGTAWVTMEGDAEDYTLSSASPLTFTGPGHLVMEAIHGDVRFSAEIQAGASAGIS